MSSADVPPSRLLPPPDRRFDASRERHHADNGCYSVALALLLDVPVETVPNFYYPQTTGKDFFFRARNWVAEFHGLSLITIPIPLKVLLTPAAMAMHFDEVNPGIPFILGGNALERPDSGHAVVCCGGAIVYEPFGVGLIGPYPEGHVDLTYLCGPISASAMSMVKA